MKNTTKALALTLAAVMGLSAVPATGCFAETAYSSAASDITQDCEFVVIMWTENDDGEITIIGCSPMYSDKVEDYPTSNVLGSFMFKGRLELPSHINDKPVTAIKGVNIAKSVGAKTVIINENITDISENAFGKGVTVLTTDKELRQSPIYY